jgi:hypothetical protein
MPMTLLDFILLRDEALTRVAFDRKYLAASIAYLIFASFLMALGYLLFPVSQGEVSYQPDLWWVLWHSLINFFVQVVYIALVFLFGKKLLKMELGRGPFFQLMGHAHIVLLFAIYPVWSPVFFLWFLLIEGTIFRRFCRFEWPLVILFLFVQAFLGWFFLYQGL